MAGYAALLAVGYLSSLLREQTDKLLLAAVGSSMALVAYYGIAARMANLMIQFYAFFGTPMISAVGALYASGDWQGVKRLFSNMSKIVPFFAGILVVLILGFYDRLIAIWLGRTIPEVLPLLAMLLISNFILVVLTGPGSALCRGIGKVGIETKFILVYLTMNFAMTVGLVLAFGAIGTVIASAASMAVSAFFFVWFLYGTLDLDRSGIRLSLLSFPIVFLCVFAAWQISAIFPLPPSRALGIIHAALMSLPVMLIYVLLMTAAGIVPHKKILNFGLAAWRR
jgi:O-antigen/teichoic acid export membrane protein